MKIRLIKNEKELKEVFDMSKDYTNNHQTWREYLNMHKKNPDLFFCVYEKGKLMGEIFGYVMDKKSCQIHSLAVFGLSWNKGIGTKLIRRFEKACRKHRKKVSVSTLGKPEKFYKKVGYSLAGLLAIYENDKRPPKFDIKPLYRNMRRRDKTRFVFFSTPNIELKERKKLIKSFKADEVCITFEKRLK